MRMLTEPFQLFLVLVCSVRCLLLIGQPLLPSLLPLSFNSLPLALPPSPCLPLTPSSLSHVSPPRLHVPPLSLLPASSNRIWVCILYFPPLSAWRFTDWTEMDWMSIEFIWIPECWKDCTYIKNCRQMNGRRKNKLSSTDILYNSENVEIKFVKKPSIGHNVKRTRCEMCTVNSGIF
jgi:hypothetical protein